MRHPWSGHLAAAGQKFIYVVAHFLITRFKIAICLVTRDESELLPGDQQWVGLFEKLLKCSR